MQSKLFLLVLFIGLLSVWAQEGDVLAEQAAESSKEPLELLGKFTRSDNDVTLEERMAANPKASAWENSGKYQGDILLDQAQLQGVSRNAYIWPRTKWPHNEIVYAFAAGHFNSRQRAAIRDGMEDISKHTCVSFRPRRLREAVYVRITNNRDGCYAHVGYWEGRGVHIFNLADNCFLHTIIVHEWFHIMGFLHMQSTYNRDNYVTVQWENIQPGFESNFAKYSSDVVSQLGLPYEYWSVMHYSRYAGSRNGRPTLIATFDDHGLMGQLDFISPIDWQRMNRHYNCEGAWD